MTQGNAVRPVPVAVLGRRHDGQAAPPLADYHTVYARQPGSAEMASGRPFTAPLLVRLMASGVTLAPVVLHAGVSSPELHEPPASARFEVPESTARLVRSAAMPGIESSR